MPDENTNLHDASDLSVIPGSVVAAEILHCSPRTLRRWVARGRLRALKTAPGAGGRLLFRRSEIARFLASLEAPLDE